jgi:hypothetical protein
MKVFLNVHPVLSGKVTCVDIFSAPRAYIRTLPDLVADIFVSVKGYVGYTELSSVLMSTRLRSSRTRWARFDGVNHLPTYAGLFPSGQSCPNKPLVLEPGDPIVDEDTADMNIPLLDAVNQYAPPGA